MVFKVTYFAIRGRAEITRLIFAQAGVEYEDERVASEDWAELKPKTKYGYMPQLEEDGFVLAQSGAIARFAAKKYGLDGKDLMEQCLADGVNDALTDILNAQVKYAFAPDDAAKEQALKDISEKMMQILPSLEKMLKDNGGKYMVGDDLTYADLAVFSSVPEMIANDNFPKELVDSFPCLQDLCTRVGELPNIKKWVESRPITDY